MRASARAPLGGHEMLASLVRHLLVGLGLLMLGGAQYLARDLHPAAGAPWETLAPDDHLVPRVALGEVPPQVEGGLAPMALAALGARGGGAAKLTLLMEERRRQPPRRQEGALL